MNDKEYVNRQCEFYEQRGKCWMADVAHQCPKSCGTCEGKDCENDVDRMCRDAADQGHCLSPVIMEHCNKTCGCREEYYEPKCEKIDYSSNGDSSNGKSPNKCDGWKTGPKCNGYSRPKLVRESERLACFNYGWSNKYEMEIQERCWQIVFLRNGKEIKRIDTSERFKFPNWEPIPTSFGDFSLSEMRKLGIASGNWTCQTISERKYCDPNDLTISKQSNVVQII